MNGKAIMLAVWLGSAIVARPGMTGERTERLLERLDANRGICVVLGDPSGELPIQLARESELLVYVQLPGAEQVDRARRKAGAAGLDATRLQIDQGNLRRLHPADNLADAVVAVSDTDRLLEAEVIADASRVTALELDGGEELWSHRLPASPVPWGMAIDRAGRVILTLVDGQVLRFGKKDE